jgi:DNA adenine methylase
MIENGEKKLTADKPPFPFFGGKSRIAARVWRAFGDVPNYVEPFAGSLAVLLSRPSTPRTETVNDLDRFIANFFRAVQHDPSAVAEAADWPVNEADLEARHFWLITEGRKRTEAILTDPEAFDAQVAGWWVWGQACWIGSGWCTGEGPWVVGEDGWTMRNPGKGVNRQLPHLGDPGQGHPHRAHLIAYMTKLAHRLRYVRVACGDWTRVLTPSITDRFGMTAVFLDPPYGEGKVDYAAGGNRTDIADAVREWAIEHAENRNLRIALCGYDGQHDMPPDWQCIEWKAAGGYSSTAANDTQGKANRHRERIWFSPHCVGKAKTLFE